MKGVNMNMCKIIKLLCELANMTQNEFDRALGVSDNVVSSWGN